ncbi:MAG: NAD(P)H-dependent oxidoreductase [Bacteroidota bacterium]
MKKILAFAGSNNAKSINYQLVEFTASQISDFEVNILDIRAWDVPMYSLDLDTGEAPEKIAELIRLIHEHDGFIIASPEHNGGTPAFFKNIIDWLSRKSKKVFDQKPVFLMSTSPGATGGATNLKYLINSLPYQRAIIGATFSLPSFYDNFKEGKVVGDQLGVLQERLNEFKEALNE